MFYGCKLLSDVTPLKNWGVYGYSLDYMFGECTSLTDLTPLQNWYALKNDKNRIKALLNKKK